MYSDAISQVNVRSREISSPSSDITAQTLDTTLLSLLSETTRVPLVITVGNDKSVAETSDPRLHSSLASAVSRQAREESYICYYGLAQGSVEIVSSSKTCTV
jgi:hypothetical protein